ncbi:MAG: glycerate kinase [Propionicimonas sp.]|nr:glycerate kinase [Propionicimonas sp.]MEA5118370.1 glycerate kinase [Propionicimonas sp.]
MRKVILIPDSFKGTMSSAEICQIMADAVHTHYPDAEIVALPVADGGEGSVDAFLTAVGGEKVTVEVNGPFPGEPVAAFYGRLDEQTAVIEMAATAGLPLVEGRQAPERTTTHGVGELMLTAARAGARHLIVGAGGSATNDLGTGAAAAAGIGFFDAAGERFMPTGGSLDRIARIDISTLAPELRNCTVTVMCDIDNPLYGERGAAAVFGPQKGASPDLVRLLDDQLRAGSTAIVRDLGVDLAEVPGAGAAGGLAGGLMAFFGASLRQGIDVVLDAVDFDQVVSDASMVFTGEGKIDSQSLSGKVVVGVARRAKPRGVPVVAVVGDIGDGFEGAYDEGVSAVFSINNLAIPFAQARVRARQDLALTMDSILRFARQLLPVGAERATTAG